MLEPTAAPANRLVWKPFNNPTRLYLALVSGGCVALFLFLSTLLGWPVYAKHEASLLASAAPVTGIAVTLVGMFLSIVLATLLLGRLRYEAGLFAACIGLGGLASRGGSVGALLRSAGQPQVYWAMLMETIMLAGLIGLGWTQLSLFRRTGWLAPEPPEDEPALPATFSTRLLAVLTQTCVMALLMFVLAQDDSPKQAMAAVVVAAVVSAIVAHQAFPIRPSLPFTIGPFLTALIGYAWALKTPGRWPIGNPANPLAAASPLDYASLGAAGGIFGYWVSRQWREMESELEMEEEIRNSEL